MAQPALYFVRLDLAEVRLLARRHPPDRAGPLDEASLPDEASPPDNDDAVDWLIARGFRLSRGGWHAGPAALDLLHPAAIRYCEPVRDG